MKAWRGILTDKEIVDVATADIMMKNSFVCWMDTSFINAITHEEAMYMTNDCGILTVASK